jgi:hypothetical protein
MKIFQNFNKLIENPSVLFLISFTAVTIIFGNLIGEYVLSRPVNSYVQAFCMLVFAFLAIQVLRTIFFFVMQNIINKQ